MIINCFASTISGIQVSMSETESHPEDDDMVTTNEKKIDAYSLTFIRNLVFLTTLFSHFEVRNFFTQKPSFSRKLHFLTTLFSHYFV